MDSNEALNFINRVLSEKGKPVLNSVEEGLFVGIWEGLEYQDIAGIIILHQLNQTPSLALVTLEHQLKIH